MALALLMVTVEVGADQTPFPKLTGRVVDQAGILSESVEGQLSAAFKRHETQTSNQVVVATINDLGSKTIAYVGFSVAWEHCNTFRTLGAQRATAHRLQSTKHFNARHCVGAFHHECNDSNSSD